jgi:hypothetical protein
MKLSIGPFPASRIYLHFPNQNPAREGNCVRFYLPTVKTWGYRAVAHLQLL